MVFSSIFFLFLFLPVVLTGYLFVGRRLRNVLLVAASLLFYAWGEREFVLVLIGSILLNYMIGSCMDRFCSPKAPGEISEAGASDSTAGKALLTIGILINLLVLGFFKYSDFLAENLAFLAGGVHPDPAGYSRLHAPVGISFFTFHAVAYLVDIYRGSIRAEKNLVRFSLYIAMFPKIMAGPIFRFRDAAKQLAERTCDVDLLISGVERFIIGLGKKILIAGPLGFAVDGIFPLSGQGTSFGTAWFGMICYTLQIYFDFSGYTDMAIGLGRMFGFRLPENFDSPYISQSIQEFWRRWHISLSLWFKDYVYIPLGGNRGPVSRTYCNLLAVFFLCGLWHGAAWTFVVWGLWHGAFLILERMKWGRIIRSAWRPLRHAYALIVVVVGWVFFRSESLHQAFSTLGIMFGLNGIDEMECPPVWAWDNEVVLALAAGLLLSVPSGWYSTVLARIFPEIDGRMRKGAAEAIRCAYILFLVLLFFLSSMSLAAGTYNPFIYFKF